jgi:two-component system, OmpR family, sensor kinase
VQWTPALPAACTVAGHPLLLRQAIDNVLGNALKFSPSDSPVEVALAVTDNLVQLSVRDYGPGVPPQLLPDIFLPFRRVSPGSPSGLGLGLAIVQRTMAIHGGSVRAENQNPGFTIHLIFPQPRIAAPVY